MYMCILVTHSGISHTLGLDVNIDHIMEIACIITDKELNIVAEVYTPASVYVP